MSTEQEIRDLCLRVSTARTTEEYDLALGHLQIVLRDYIMDTENRAIKMLIDLKRSKLAASGE